MVTTNNSGGLVGDSLQGSLGNTLSSALNANSIMSNKYLVLFTDIAKSLHTVVSSLSKLNELTQLSIEKIQTSTEKSKSLKSSIPGISSKMLSLLRDSREPTELNQLMNTEPITKDALTEREKKFNQSLRGQKQGAGLEIDRWNRALEQRNIYQAALGKSEMTMEQFSNEVFGRKQSKKTGSGSGSESSESATATMGSGSGGGGLASIAGAIDPVAGAVVSGISYVLGPVVSFAKELKSAGMSRFYGGFMQVFDPIWDILQAIGTQFGTSLVPLVETVSNFLMNQLPKIDETITTEIMPAVQRFVDEDWPMIEPALGTLVDSILRLTSTSIIGFFEFLGSKQESIIQAIELTIDTLNWVASDIMPWLKPILSWVFDLVIKYPTYVIRSYEEMFT